MTKEEVGDLETLNREVKGAYHMKKKKLTQPAVPEERFVVGFQILSRWLQLRQAGKKLVPFFEDNFIAHVAIYGMGVLGERLCEELQGTKIIIDYAIDRFAASKKRPGLKIYGLEEDVLPEVDAIVVTPVQDYWSIVELLQEKVDAPVMSLRDVVDYCLAGD